MLHNGLAPWHLLIVAIVIIVLFGSKKLPEAARGLGRSMRILKSEAKAMKGDEPAGSTGSLSAGSAEPGPRVAGAAPGETVTARTAAGDDPARP
ncbi:Sec-independent protein translocase subunit TatA [Streptomyces acidicola]|uniref:Sec-independent protein translocase subunit TatA n=1 Tax=Streptomyces acidicola TaxID=2596892 RepID=UPI0038304C98